MTIPYSDIDKVVQNAFIFPIATIRLMRENYWPLIEVNSFFHIENLPAALVEYLVVIQAFGFFGECQIETTSETKLNANDAQRFVHKYQIKNTCETKLSVINEVFRYFNVLDGWGILGGIGKTRIINILINSEGKLLISEESNVKSNVRFMERAEEAHFRHSLDVAVDDSFMKFFMREATAAIMNLCNIQYIDIISPDDNLWLYEHNRNRTKISLDKTNYNLYTKNSLGLGGKRMARGKGRIARS